MSNKLRHAKALYLEGILEGNSREAVEKYTGDKYTQHSTGVRDGAEGFVEFFEPFIQRNPVRHIEIVRGFEDGQHVFVQAYQSLNNGESQWVTMDFFDTDGHDKIIEHWDVIEAFEGKNPSGRTQVDGEVEIIDLDRTDENKKIVRACIENSMMPNGDIKNAGKYISEQCIQHNRFIADGIESYVNSFQTSEVSQQYEEIVILIGHGNFVATLCRVSRNGQEFAQTDLFRLEQGKIIEHWDAAEPVPAEDELVNSGKF